MPRQTAIRNLVAAIDDYLGRFDGPGIADVRAGIARFRDGPLRDVRPARIAAVDHVETALAAIDADGEARPLGEAIKAALPYLAFSAYNPYPRDLIGGHYADNHTMAAIIGIDGQIFADDFDLGLFGFAANTLYRDHRHAAPELYAPLTGPNGWRFGSGDPLVWKPAHQPVWNEAWAQHCFRSGPLPYLCVFGWTRDVQVPAEMIVELDWATLEASPAPD
jgi:hypothetical protein